AGSFTNQVVTTANYLLDGAQKVQRDKFLAAYLGEAELKLKEKKGFPLIKATARILPLEKLKDVDKLLTYIWKDLQSHPFQNLSAKEHPEVSAFTNRVGNLNRVSK